MTVSSDADLTVWEVEEMPHTCIVIGCTNRSGREKKNFYNIPAIIKHQGEQTEELSMRRRREWIAAIEKKGELPKSSKICSDHFISGKPAALFDVKNQDWVPSRLMRIEKRKKSQCSSKTPSKKKTLSCSKNGSAIKKHCAAAIDLLHFANGTTSSDVQNFGDRTNHCSFVLKGKLEGELHCDVDRNSLKLFGTECQQLREENTKLKERLFCLEMSEAFFQDNKKVEYYTGLPTNRILFTLFKCVEDFIVLTGMSTLTKFQKFILTLMKLRLALSMQDLSYRFDVSVSCVSRIFISVLDVLYVRLKRAIFWPDRKQLQEKMPSCFLENFESKVVVIIDCLEISIQRPLTLVAQNQMSYTFKKHNRRKYFLAFAPHGLVTFTSEGWDGNCSDQLITEKCGLLEMLLPGDVILVDRGSNICDLVSPTSSKVRVPAFTNSKSQLSSLAVDDAKKLADCKVHVERLIGLVQKKYAILKETFPTNFLQRNSKEASCPVLDKIVTVCSALVNCRDSVVTFTVL